MSVNRVDSIPGNIKSLAFPLNHCIRNLIQTQSLKCVVFYLFSALLSLSFRPLPELLSCFIAEMDPTTFLHKNIIKI